MIPMARSRTHAPILLLCLETTMSHPRIFLAASFALLSILLFVPHAEAQSTSAYVYVQVGGRAGAVYGYNASSSGQLSAISGSPFNLGTEIIGSNKSEFITMGKTLLHSYAMAPDGAIQSQLSQIPFQDYAGGSCAGQEGGQAGAVLDHSGKYIYVALQNLSCAAYQSYLVNSDGTFTFDGDTEKSLAAGESDTVGLPSILGNESFAYANEWIGHYSNLIGLKRESPGTLELMNFGETDPTLSGGDYLPAYPDASPVNNYAVVQLYPNDGSGDSGFAQLGSYLVDSQGNLSTTNTSSDMPTTQLENTYSTFSPDGKYFVLYGNAQNGAGHLGNGIEIYNFNGSAPLTLNTTLLNGTPIDQVEWDTSGHLYALSRSEGKLWVYDVGPSSTGLDSVSSIGSPVSMVVVSETTGGEVAPCNTPASPGVNVCSPDDNATVPSPVQIDATGNVSGGVYRFELWNGNTKLLSSDNDVMNQSLPLSAGTYTLTFDTYNSDKSSHEYATRTITVSGGGTCAAPSGDGVNVCSPAEGSTVSSPVAINAAANISGGVYRFSLWNGNTKLMTVRDSGVMDSTVSLAAGTYKLTFDARNTSGVHEYATRDITVK